MFIMILGGSLMQLPALRLAKEQGWKILLVDGAMDIPGRAYADYFEQIDLKDLRGLIVCAKQYNKIIPLNGIFTAGTDFSWAVAGISEALNLPGIPYNTAVNASHKDKMRSVFRDNNVSTVNFIVLSQKTDYREVCNRLDFPLVVKPVDNMGARGTRKVETLDDLQLAVETAIQFSRSNTVIVEEYIHGPEFSLDALICDGEITICGFADRHICFEPYFIEMGHTIPTQTGSKIQAAVIHEFKAGIRALGIENGAAKGDIKYTGETAVVGEIAARLSGGYMSGWTFPYATEFDVTEKALQIACGLDIAALDYAYKNVSAERALISIPGTLKQIQGVKAAEHVRNVKNVFVTVSVGQKVTFPKNNVEKAANVISQSVDAKTAVCSAERALHKIQLVLEPLNSETMAFLLDKIDRHSGCAFELKDITNLRALESMPYGACSDSHRLTVYPLPKLLSESTYDWHNELLSDAYSTICQRYTLIETTENSVFAKSFWLAMLKGGKQAASWFIDSYLTLNTHTEKADFINTWNV